MLISHPAVHIETAPIIETFEKISKLLCTSHQHDLTHYITLPYRQQGPKGIQSLSIVFTPNPPR